MGSAVALVAVLVYVSVSRVAAIKCLSCATAARPRDCEFVQECGPHEKCSVQSILTTGGYTMYSVGCTDIHKCTSFVGKRAILNATDLQEIQRQNEFGAIPDEQWDQGTKNVILCAECCDTELCNVKGCGEEGLPAGSGPVCYGCDQQRDPYNCNQIVLCGLDEECHLSSKMIGIDKVYQSGCFKRTACQLLEHPGDNVLVGRRQRVVDMLTIQKRASFCNKCCTGNLCNFGNCSSLVYQTNTLTPMTYPATTQAVLTPVNGGWNAWSSWNQCSVTCGQGSHDRFRVCNNPQPAYGGATCSGSNSETQLCTQQMCAVNGGWNAWSSWNQCSVTCGQGSHDRFRVCNNPQPAYGGATCSGPSTETQLCTQQMCAVNGGWSAWSSWNQCSVTCGQGSHDRFRVCNNPHPAYGGATCSGPSTETQLCTQQMCAVNGGWSAWSSWNQCSVTCGKGSHDRFRVCNNPHPAYGGATCSGPSTETQLCTQQMCAVDGQWSLWTTWSICSKTCGTGGTRFRQRTCDNPPPSVGGKDCAQSPYQSQDCDGLVAPNVIQTTINFTKPEGSDIAIQCLVPGSTPLQQNSNIQWMAPQTIGKPFPPNVFQEDDGSLDIIGLTLENTGPYYCQITTPCGTYDSARFYVNIQ